ncbi:hypothetical protein ABEB36_008055 [Hypothenemus hampei]|uniref:Uncharacterized protein n=1 Tax=Hypothenemus hampei TaxID=57062 RepID=A0ABD1EKJ2_HYPHA
MCNFKLLIVSISSFLPQIRAGLVTVSDIQHENYHHQHPKYGSHDVDYYSPPKYAFKYGVSDPHTGDHKTQTEVRDGEVVKGQYSLVEPDGSIRTVSYVADPVNGFNAVVSKSGPNVHTEPQQHLSHNAAVIATPVKAVVPQYIKPVVPSIVKPIAVAPPVVQYQKPIIKYTSAIGYPKTSGYYNDYDTAYEYPEAYDLQSYYGDINSRY